MLFKSKTIFFKWGKHLYCLCDENLQFLHESISEGCLNFSLVLHDHSRYKHEINMLMELYFITVTVKQNVLKLSTTIQISII